ncbi:MAG: hypothetical protein V8R01_01510 [Bacilli bacterium]
MVKKLKDILNTYTDKELNNMDLWINALDKVEIIYIEDDDIILITEEAEVKINDYVEKEGK